MTVGDQAQSMERSSVRTGQKNCGVTEALSKMNVYTLEKSCSVLAEGYCPLE